MTLNLDIVCGVSVVYIKNVVLYYLVLGSKRVWLGRLLETSDKDEVCIA